MNAMSLKDALETCEHRIQYCANLYGANFKTELPFLMACEEALKADSENIKNCLTEDEIDFIEGVFENYYQEDIYAIARESEVAESIFEKMGIIEKKEELFGEEER